MVSIDSSLLDVNEVICKQFNQVKSDNRGDISQNILAQLRTFVELVIMKIDGRKLNPNIYNDRVKAIDTFKKNPSKNVSFISDFYDLLQDSVSHYTVNQDGSERLMLRYYEYLLRIKKLLINRYDIEVLQNIDKFPLRKEYKTEKYHQLIAQKIENRIEKENVNFNVDRFYVKSIRPFFNNHEVYYEVTLNAVNSKNTKFSSIIAFTKLDILANYSVKLSLKEAKVEVFERGIIPIYIIDDWKVSIRPCELNNFARIFGIDLDINAASIEYERLMKYLTSNQCNLNELIESADSSAYGLTLENIITNDKSKLKEAFDYAREIIKNNKPGSNVIRYLLFRMNNRIIKEQLSDDPCEKLSNLYLKYNCIPFDNIPYDFALCNHNPKLFDLYKCIDPKKRKDELLARYVRNEAEFKRQIFTPISELTTFKNIDNLINTYNNKLYYKHRKLSALKKYKKFIYINEYAEDVHKILNILIKLTSSGVAQYTQFAEQYVKNKLLSIDREKKQYLVNLFSKSHVAVIYGAAGTGKTTMVSNIADMYSKSKKLFLANTNTAVNNLKSKVTASDSEFRTIYQQIRSTSNNYDIVFVDECSTISNYDMNQLLSQLDFKLLVLVGDSYQIGSVQFGNWFDILKMFIPKSSIFELTEVFRTESRELKNIWCRVRNLDDSFLEPLIRGKYTELINHDIFKTNLKDDEILLCLNYDGLYGINNMNRILQQNNPNEAYQWGIHRYKVGDPVIINDPEKFNSPDIYNNMKGRIIKIEKKSGSIIFTIKLDITLNLLNIFSNNIISINQASDGKSIISFEVFAPTSSDYDINYNGSMTSVPFQVAYAISIHKAQGLEYNSVKIVITNEIEDQLNFNIFYTAITRTKEKLKIFWTPETEQCITKKFVDEYKQGQKSNKRDVGLLKQMYRDLKV